MKIVVYGNCQAAPLGSFLALAGPRVELLRVPAVHTIKPEHGDRIRETFGQADVVISQPIGPSFNDLSTDALKAEFPGATWVSVPSIYFSGFFPTLFYLRSPKGGAVKGPLGDYHDRRIAGAYLAGWEQTRCIETMQEMLVHDQAVYDAALQESLDRQAALDIKIMDVVQDVEAGRPLHTFNHPSNHVMWTMAHRVLSFLDLPLSNAATRPEREILDEIRAPVPDGLLAVQGASWRAPHFVVRGEALPDDRLVASFYESYAELDDFKGLMEFNERRFGPQSRFADLGWQLPKPTGSA